MKKITFIFALTFYLLSSILFDCAAQEQVTDKKQKVETLADCLKQLKDIRDSIAKAMEESQKPKINTNVFTINLSNPSQGTLKSSERTRRLSIRSRDLLQVELTGGNPYKYKYVLNNKLINFFEDKTENPIVNLQKVINSRPVTEEVSGEEKDEKNKKEIKKLEESLEEQQKKIKEKEEEITVLLEKIKRLPKNSFERIKNEEEIKEKKSEQDSLENKIKPEIERKIYELNIYRYLAVNSYNIVNTESDKNTFLLYPQNINEDKSMLFDALVITRRKTEDLNALLLKNRIKTKATEILDYPTYAKKRDTLYRIADTLSINFSKIKIDISKFDDISDRHQNLVESIKFNLNSIFMELQYLYSVKLENYTLPLDFNGKNSDVIEVSLERFDDGNPIPIDKNTYNIWIKGGFKIDISGGVFLTSLVNKEYYTIDKTVDVNGVPVELKAIREREKGNFEFGFGSAINISHRSASWINPTLNVGALFTVNQQFQMLTGLGVILGKEERIIFTSGLSMGRVNRISEAFKADGETPYDLGDGSIPSSSQFDFGYYFGITYNFSKSKKAN